MNYPKLKTRPQSIHTCTNFRGLDRRPDASSRTRNKSWQWFWHDECNLSADRIPRLSVRKKRQWANYVDGNSIADSIAAVCSGDHLVILDSMGYLWSNGHAVDLSSYFAMETAWRMTTYGDSKPATFDPATGSSLNSSGLGGLVAYIGVNTYKYIRFVVTEVDDEGNATSWESNKSGLFGPDDPGNYGITVDPEGDTFYVGWSFQVYLWKRSTCTIGSQLVRMGTNVLLIHDGTLKLWANAVRLASGQTMTAGTHYGLVKYETSFHGTLENETTFTLCDENGAAYSTAVVSAAEPASQDEPWLDISCKPAVLRQYAASTATWVPIPNTYVKISPVTLTDSNGVSITAGDTIHIKASFFPDFTDNDVRYILEDTYHHIEKVMTTSIVIPGILTATSRTNTASYTITREPPKLDFVVEAQNRLWGCRYDEANSINEIYASKLGDFKNWDCFQGLSTDSWRASRGTAAPFTGAVSMSGYPLFFREESLEKVFPNAAGAHQIAVYAMEGVQKGCAYSMVLIDEKLFYKGRQGVCVYTGTLPTRISDEFGDWIFSNARAGRHKKKYVMCADRKDGERMCLVYDMETGDWHVEDGAWAGLSVTWSDELYYTVDYYSDYNLYKFESTSADGIEWYAESDDLTLELPEHKWITCIRIRFKLDKGAEARVHISYDDGVWERKAALHGNSLNTDELLIWPRRCDHFKLKLEGIGGFELQSISYRVERSEGGH